MGNLFTTVKESTSMVKDRVCGIYDLFRYEQSLSETVIHNFDFDPETHFRDAEYHSYQDPPQSRLR